MKKIFGERISEKRGAVAVEYALITGLVAVVIASTVSELGIRVRDVFQSIITSLPA